MSTTPRRFWPSSPMGRPARSSVPGMPSRGRTPNGPKSTERRAVWSTTTSAPTRFNFRWVHSWHASGNISRCRCPAPESRRARRRCTISSRTSPWERPGRQPLTMAAIGGTFLAVNLHMANAGSHPWLLPLDANATTQPSFFQ